MLFWNKKRGTRVNDHPISFLGSCSIFHTAKIENLNLLQNHTETLATQASGLWALILATLGSSLWQYWNVTIDWAFLDCIPLLSYSSVGVLYNTLVSLSPWAQDLTSRDSTFKLFYGWKQDYRKTILLHQFVMAESLFLAVHIYTNIRQKSTKIWVSYYLQQSLLILGLNKLFTS